MDLDEIRQEIDTVDNEIVALLEERMKLVTQVSAFKQRTGKAIYDPEREQDQLALPGGQALDQPAQPPGLVLPLTSILHAETVLQYIGKGQCAVLLSRFQCFLQGNDHAISALPAKMHPQLICYPLPSALWDGKEDPPLSRNDASTSKWIFGVERAVPFFCFRGCHVRVVV